MIAIYARQSIEKKDSLSIEGQIELCRRECESEPTIFKDAGYSGKNTNRPAFQRLLTAVRLGEIEKIVVYRLDRISRSITDFGAIWQLLDAHHAEFVSVSEKFDTSTPVGRAMVYIIMVFAQLERETICQRVKDNYFQRSKRGAWGGGPAPFGWKLVRTEIDGKKATTLEPTDEAGAVKELFRRYAYTSDSLGTLAKYMTDSPYSGRRRKAWDNVAIARILHNPTYVRADADVYAYFAQKGITLLNDIGEFTGERGMIWWGKRDRNAAKYTTYTDQFLALSSHCGIIDSGTYLMCQRKLEENRQLKRAGTGKYSWLSGLVKCGACGYSMRAISSCSGKYASFYCSGRTNLHLCEVQHGERIDTVEAEAEKRIQTRTDEISSMAPVQAKDNHNTEKIKLKKLDDEISALMDKIPLATDATMKYINARIDGIDAERQNLLKSISQPEESAFRFSGMDFNNLSFDAKKVVAQALVDRVELLNGNIKIIFK